MARTQPRRPETSTTTPEASAQDAVRDTAGEPPMDGGSPGLPAEDANDPNLHRAETRIPGVPYRGEAPQLDLGSTRPAGPVSKRYKVTGGPQNVSVAGSGLVKFYFGKTVDEKDYDIENLRRQGVQLQDITPAQPAATAAA